MNQIHLYILGVIIIICTYAVHQFGDEDFHQTDIVVQSYQVEGNEMKFNISDDPNNYVIELPRNVQLKENSKVIISFEERRDKIVDIEKLIVDGVVVWDISHQERIKLTTQKNIEQ